MPWNDIILIIVGILMIRGGLKASRQGYFRFWFKIGKSIYYRDKDPIMFNYCVTGHVVGGALVIVLAILSWLGLADIHGRY